MTCADEGRLVVDAKHGAAISLLRPRWEFNVGVRAGLTPATDRLVIKMILGYRFGPLPAPEPGP